MHLETSSCGNARPRVEPVVKVETVKLPASAFSDPDRASCGDWNFLPVLSRPPRSTSPESGLQGGVRAPVQKHQ